jgi:long-chain fatty acid transport protein
MKIRLQKGLGALLALSMTSQAFALGTASYSSELISTRSLGQGGTGVAGVQEDPIVGYTNPAAMTSMKGTQVTAGFTYANATPKFTNGATSSGGFGTAYTQGNQGDVSGARATSVLIPNFGATTQLMDGRLAIGLAAVSPYGLETHFDGDSPIRYQTTDARLRIVDVTPSIAYKVNDVFSVGAGADYYNTLEGSLEKKVNMQELNYGLLLQATGNPAVARGGAIGPDANSRLNGTGDGWGYHLGTTIRPNEHHQIGIVYHSAVNISLTGNVQLTGFTGTATTVFGQNFTADASAPLYMPQNVQVGYAWMPTDKTQVEFDAAWYDYYSGRALGVVYNNLTANQSAVLNKPSANPTVFNPRKTMNFALGVNHKCTDNFQARVGGYYQAAALPENAFDSAFVDLPRYALTAGAGWKVSDSFSADVAYNAVFFHGRAINNPDANAAIGAPASGYTGNFNSFANILSASLTYRTAAHF